MKNKFDVLILNMDYTPHDIWAWQHTMSKLYNEAIDYLYDISGHILKHNKIIRDGHGNIYDLPSVAILKQFIGVHNKMAPYTKRNIYARDFNICQYCGEDASADLTIDHVIPRAHWNPRRFHFKLNSFENIVTCCRACNLRKRNRTPQQAGMTLIKKPKRITRQQAYANKLAMRTYIPNDWRQYINVQEAKR